MIIVTSHVIGLAFQPKLLKCKIIPLTRLAYVLGHDKWIDTYLQSDNAMIYDTQAVKKDQNQSPLPAKQSPVVKGDSSGFNCSVHSSAAVQVD